MGDDEDVFVASKMNASVPVSTHLDCLCTNAFRPRLSTNAASYDRLHLPVASGCSVSEHAPILVRNLPNGIGESGTTSKRSHVRFKLFSCTISAFKNRWLLIGFIFAATPSSLATSASTPVHGHTQHITTLSQDAISSKDVFNALK